jgi:hypothetical protein
VGYVHYSPMMLRLLHLLIIDILATSLALRRQLFIQVRKK